MQEYLQRAEKIYSRIEELAAISEVPGMVTRTFGTAAFLKGSQLVKSWMEEAGLKTWVDNIGNVRGRLASSLPTTKTLVIASHIDTVANAGKFDGPLGVLMGLDLLENLIHTKTALPFNLELIAFSDEEGVRFHTTYLGSKVVAGSFSNNILEQKDATDITLKEVLTSIGAKPEKLDGDAINPEDWLGYFEIHIEQGPILYDQNIPVALVTAIAGQNRIEITFTGFAGHAGTVPMTMRQDALCAAAEFILAVETYALVHKNDIVATVGKLNIANPASNVIPGAVTCSLDLRSSDKAILQSAHLAIQTLGRDICRNRNISFDWNLVQETEPVICDINLNKLLAQAISGCEYEVLELVSGAGHDAVPVSKVAPVTMLFLRCYKGISHNPLENVDLKDIAAGLQVSEKFIHGLLNNYEL